jgi:hypothetical protein
MAYVAITENTVDEIRTKIALLARREIESLGAQPINESFQGLSLKADLVEAHFWKRYEHLRASTPHEWLVKTRSFRVKLVPEDGNPVSCAVDYRRTALLEKIGMVADRGMLLPPNAPDQYGNSIYSQQLFCPPEFLGLTEEDIACQRSYMVRRDAVVAKWDGVRSQVVRFLEQCKSLNQAVKLMPSFRLYVPQDMLDRIDEKVSRSPNKGKDDKDPMAGIDVGALNVAAVTAKLLGA